MVDDSQQLKHAILPNFLEITRRTQPFTDGRYGVDKVLRCGGELVSWALGVGHVILYSVCRKQQEASEI